MKCLRFVTTVLLYIYMITNDCTGQSCPANDGTPKMVIADDEVTLTCCGQGHSISCDNVRVNNAKVDVSATGYTCEGSRFIVVSEARPQDGGNWTCECCDSAETCVYCFVPLQVQGKAIFAEEGPVQLTVTLGQRVDFNTTIQFVGAGPSNTKQEIKRIEFSDGLDADISVLCACDSTDGCSETKNSSTLGADATCSTITLHTFELNSSLIYIAELVKDADGFIERLSKTFNLKLATFTTSSVEPTLIISSTATSEFIAVTPAPSMESMFTPVLSPTPTVNESGNQSNIIIIVASVISSFLVLFILALFVSVIVIIMIKILYFDSRNETSMGSETESQQHFHLKEQYSITSGNHEKPSDLNRHSAIETDTQKFDYKFDDEQSKDEGLV